MDFDRENCRLGDYSNKVVTEIAREIGLDPDDYPNRDELCDAIYARRAIELPPSPQLEEDHRPRSLEVGRSDCGYIKVKALGAGAYGTVYRVRRDDRLYALKEIRSSSGEVDASQMIEATILASARHPCVSRAYDIYFDCDRRVRPYPVIHYLLAQADEDLHAWSQRDHTMKEKLEVLHQVVSGLAFLHQHQVVHGDLKPDNILLVDGMAKLSDFSVSRRYTGRPLQSELQTLNYRAPEIIFRASGLEGDVWALGCVMWELFNEFPLFELEAPFSEARLLDEILQLLGKPDTFPNEAQQAYYQQLRDQIGDDPVSSPRSIPLFEEVTTGVQRELQRLFDGCLTVDPSVRITAEQILESPLFQYFPVYEGAWSATGPRQYLPPSAQSILYPWLERVRTLLHHNTATLALAFDLFERFYGAVKVIQKGVIQLVGCVCYSLAVMLNEPRSIKAETYLRLCNGSYNLPGWNYMFGLVVQELDFVLWPDNWVTSCLNVERQREVTFQYTEGTLSEDEVECWRERWYDELCHYV